MPDQWNREASFLLGFAGLDFEVVMAHWEQTIIADLGACVCSNSQRPEWLVQGLKKLSTHLGPPGLTLIVPRCLGCAV